MFNVLSTILNRKWNVPQCFVTPCLVWIFVVEMFSFINLGNEAKAKCQKTFQIADYAFLKHALRISCVKQFNIFSNFFLLQKYKPSCDIKIKQKHNKIKYIYAD